MRIRPLATGTTMLARRTMIVRRWLPRRTVSVTLVPARPLISEAAKSGERLASEVEPTSTIMSPRARPALAAGEPGNTSWTSSPWGWT